MTTPNEAESDGTIFLSPKTSKPAPARELPSNTGEKLTHEMFSIAAAASADSLAQCVDWASAGEW